MKISVVVNTLNEEKHLPTALSSVKGLADEIIVVDMRSDDKTVAIAKKFGARVFKHPRVSYVEPARNFAISKAQNEWILVLDADEELPPALREKLKEIKENSLISFYRIPRKNIIFDKWIRHARWWPDYNIRFFRKGKVIWSELIHSVPETHGKGLDLASEEKYAIVHHNYQSVESFIERMNRYTTIQANSLVKDGYEGRWQDFLARPSKEFISRYFAAEGYKDGLHGLALCSLQAFSELVVYVKLWQARKFVKRDLRVREVISEIRSGQKELNYWLADTLLKEGGGIVSRVKRKLKLR